MTIFAAFLGQMVGGFLGRVLCEWLFNRGLSDDQKKHLYKEGFWEGYRLAMREENDEKD